MMLLQLVRALWGGVLLVAPRALLDRVGEPSEGVVLATRVLGARHLIEVLIAGRHRRLAPRWMVAIDLTHAASMLGVAAFSRRLRPDALASATTAGLLTGWGELERRTASRR